MSAALLLLFFSADLSQVCDIDEDSAYVAERVEKLTSAYEALQKELKERLSLLELRNKSWEHFPVEEATQVRQGREGRSVEGHWMCLCMGWGSEFGIIQGTVCTCSVVSIRGLQVVNFRILHFSIK